MRIDKQEDVGPCDVVVNKSGPKRCGIETAFTTEMGGQTFRICLGHIEDQRQVDNKQKVV